MSIVVSQISPLQIERRAQLRDMFLLSPFVWREGPTYKMLLRAVPSSDDPAQKIARVQYAESNDGLRFTLPDKAAIAPGPSADDKDGCEDPTVCIVDACYYVYYTGWNETEKRGRLMLAAGADVQSLEKRGTAMAWTPERKNPKEATVVQAADGSWRMFFEYAADEKSKIGLASAPAVNGPWDVLEPLFEARADFWDSWHVSTGPIVTNKSGAVMFYNGATRDAAWRIGWIRFDAGYSRVEARCEEPLIVPPPQRESGATDIAFAASALQEDGIVQLYYSIADRDMCRATLVST